MNNALAVLKVAFRAATWRATPPFAPCRSAKPPALRICAHCTARGPANCRQARVGGFNPYGINAAIAWIALEIAVAALLVPPGARTSALSAMLILTCIAELASVAAKVVVALVPSLAAAASVVSRAVYPLRDLRRCVAVVDWSDGGSVAQLRAATAALHAGASRRALGCAPRRQCRRAARADFCWPRFRYSHRQSMGIVARAVCDGRSS